MASVWGILQIIAFCFCYVGVHSYVCKIACHVQVVFVWVRMFVMCACHASLLQIDRKQKRGGAEARSHGGMEPQMRCLIVDEARVCQVTWVIRASTQIRLANQANEPSEPKWHFKIKLCVIVFAPSQERIKLFCFTVRVFNPFNISSSNRREAAAANKLLSGFNRLGPNP